MRFLLVLFGTNLLFCIHPRGVSSFTANPTLCGSCSRRRQQPQLQRVFPTTNNLSLNKPQSSLPMSSSSSSSTKGGASSIALPDKEMLEQVLNVAIDASRKAGAIILGNAGGAEVTKSKANSRDLLTLIDPLCEKVNSLSLTLPNIVQQMLYITNTSYGLMSWLLVA
jgi:hypothetical protein